MAEQHSNETKNHRSVKLTALRKADNDAIDITAKCLERDGFVFLDMTTDKLVKDVVPIVEEVAAELTLSCRGGKGSHDAIVGHVSGRYKDSLRLLSGNQYNSPSFWPQNKNIETLVKSLDEAAMDIVKALAQPFFGCLTIDQVGETYDLPLLQKNLQSNDQASFGLIDIVCYHNQPDSPGFIVSSHQDPGLLILSLPELSPGLELLELSSGKWIAPPKGLGVLWAGARAAQNKSSSSSSSNNSRGVQPCTHRVRTVMGTPRVACWHEICTSTQISPPMLRKLQEDGMELALANNTSIQGTQQVLETLRRAENHEPVDTGSGKFLRITPVAETVGNIGVPLMKSLESLTVRIPMRTTGKRHVFSLPSWARR